MRWFHTFVSLTGRRRNICLALSLDVLPAHSALRLEAQGPADVPQQIQALTDSIARVQAQLEQSQAQLQELRSQLAAVQSQVSRANAPGAEAGSPAEAEPGAVARTSSRAESPGTAQRTTAAAVEELRETQDVQGAQIAVHEQTKVESDSRYPVRISGMLLFNAYTNSGGVDTPADPTYSTSGKGTTGASVRQTLLGVSARGPHWLRAASAADLEVDFFANPGSSSTVGAPSVGYDTSPAVLRLRTAHATLDWAHTQAFFNLDRPLLSPDVPHSLSAVATPEFGWAGYLWRWNPQLGLRHDQQISESISLRLQAALLDVGDAPLTPPAYVSFAGPAASAAESSRVPATEARVALVGPKLDDGAHLGVGGYFSPHSTSDGRGFDAWAGTVDGRLPIAHHLALTGSAYRGLALGGLGAGVYKDYLYRTLSNGSVAFRPFSDVGGWAQLQARLNERVELNAGFGIDEGFAREIRPFTTPASGPYQSLSRNRAASANVIYSPSAYLLLSLEYRRLDSLLTNGMSSSTSVVGFAAGYRF